MFSEGVTAPRTVGTASIPSACCIVRLFVLLLEIRQE